MGNMAYEAVDVLCPNGPAARAVSDGALVRRNDGRIVLECRILKRVLATWCNEWNSHEERGVAKPHAGVKVVDGEHALIKSLNPKLCKEKCVKSAIEL